MHSTHINTFLVWGVVHYLCLCECLYVQYVTVSLCVQLCTSRALCPTVSLNGDHFLLCSTVLCLFSLPLLLSLSSHSLFLPPLIAPSGLLCNGGTRSTLSVCLMLPITANHCWRVHFSLCGHGLISVLEQRKAGTLHFFWYSAFVVLHWDVYRETESPLEMLSVWTICIILRHACVIPQAGSQLCQTYPWLTTLFMREIHAKLMSH